MELVRFFLLLYVALFLAKAPVRQVDQPSPAMWSVLSEAHGTSRAIVAEPVQVVTYFLVPLLAVLSLLALFQPIYSVSYATSEGQVRRARYYRFSGTSPPLRVHE